MEEQKQRKVKGLSKALYIIAKVLKVFLIIGFVGVILAMVIVPLLFSSFKVKDGSIEFFDEKITYEVSDSKIVFNNTRTNDKYTVTEEVDSVAKLLDKLENSNFAVPAIIIEVGFIMIEVILVVSYLIFKNAEKLFKNIHDKDTPFLEENTNYIKKISKLLLISIIIRFIFSGFFGLFGGSSTFNLDLNSVIYLLIIIVIGYIFEYGTKLQENSDTKMYNE